MDARFPLMHCERCGVEAPCMRVTLFQNVGAIILRFTSTVSGMLCKRCIDACTVRMSAISFFFGWWGIISFFVNAVTLPLNVVTWLRSLSLPAAPASPSDPYAPVSAPAARSGTDVLAVVSLALGGAAILITLLFAALGVGMMVAPNQPEDVQSGMICMVTSALVCGLPGAIGLGAGFFRLRRSSKSR